MLTPRPHAILPVVGPLFSLFLPRSRGAWSWRRIRYVDGANTFDLYQLTALTRTHGADPRRLLRQIVLAWAFTSPQLVTLVTRLVTDILRGLA